MPDFPFQVIVNKSITLDCQASDDSSPIDAITWTRDGTKLGDDVERNGTSTTNSNPYAFSENHRHLIIHHVKRTDHNSTFACIASNLAGETGRKFRLEVKKNFGKILLALFVHKHLELYLYSEIATEQNSLNRRNRSCFEI